MELLHMGQSGWLKMARSEMNVNNIDAFIVEDCSLTCHQIAVIMDYLKSTIKNIMLISQRCGEVEGEMG